MKSISLLATIAVSLSLLTFAAHAAEPDQTSRHKLYRECMAKQKEADSGKNHDEMKAFCEDYAKTQRDAEKTGDKPEPKT